MTIVIQQGVAIRKGEKYDIAKWRVQTPWGEREFETKLEVMDYLQELFENWS